MDDDLDFITNFNQIELGDENNSSIDGNEITTESVSTVNSDLPYDIWLSDIDQYIQYYSKIKLDCAKTNEKYKQFLLADYFARIKIEENLEDKVSRSGRSVRLSAGISISVDSVSSAGESVQSSDGSQDLLENIFLPETTSVRNVSYPFLGDGENKIVNAYIDDTRTVGYGRKEDLHCLSYNNSFDPRLKFEGLFNKNRNDCDEGDAKPTMSEEELAQNVFLSLDDAEPIVEKYLNSYRKLLQNLNGNQTEEHAIVSRTLKPSSVDIPVTDDGTTDCKKLFHGINSNSIKKLWNSTDNKELLGSTDVPARGDDHLRYKHDEVEDQKQNEIINDHFSKSKMNPKTNSDPHEEAKDITDEKAGKCIPGTKTNKQKRKWHASWWSVSTEDPVQCSGYNKHTIENEQISKTDERNDIKDSGTWNIPNISVSGNTTAGNLVSLTDPKQCHSLTKSDDPPPRENTSDARNTKSVNWAKFFKISEKDPKERKEASAESKKEYNFKVCSEDPQTTMNVTLRSKLYPTTKSFQPSMAKVPQDVEEQTIPPNHQNGSLLYPRPYTTQYPAIKFNDHHIGWSNGSLSTNTMRIDQAKQDVHHKQTTPHSMSFNDFGSTSGINIQPPANVYQDAAYKPPSHNPSLNVVPLPAGFNNVAPPLDGVNMSYQPLSQSLQHLFQIQHPRASIGTQQQSCYEPCTVSAFQLRLLSNIPNANAISTSRYGHHSPHPQPSARPRQLRHQTQNQYIFQGSQQQHNIQQRTNSHYQQQLMVQSLFRLQFNQPTKTSTVNPPGVTPASNWTLNQNNNSIFNNDHTKDDMNVSECSTQQNSIVENIPSIVHSDQRKVSSIKDKIKLARHRNNRSNLVRIYPKSDIQIL